MKIMYIVLLALVLSTAKLNAEDNSLNKYEFDDNLGLEALTYLSDYYAQIDMPPEVHPPVGKGPPFHNRKQLEKERKHIERFRLLKLLELLELDDDKEIEFMAAFRKHRKNQRQLSREKNRTINKLADGLRFNIITEKEIKKKIEKIDRLDMEIQERNQQFNNRMKAILNHEQLGKLYVFQARFEVEVLGQMAEFRRQREKMQLEKNILDKPRKGFKKKDSFR